MKKYLYMAVAAIAAFSSCSNDNDAIIGDSGNQPSTFTATVEGATTRATYDATYKCASWEVNDVISIDGHEYTANVAGTTSTFTGTGATEAIHHAYFPATLYNGGTPTLPATQTYTDGKFDMPMYAESTTTDLQFKNLCAVLAIKISSTDIATLKSIKVKSDKKMNGSFTVTDNKAVVGDDGTNELVLMCSEPLNLSASATTFYIAIPSQVYAYLNIYLSSDGKTYTQAMATKNVFGLGNIARSKIFNIDYVKNATKIWRSTVFFADYNIGATSPEEYGGYYAWGGSQDRVDDHFTGNVNLSGDNDTATKLWGINWRMPLSSEYTASFNDPVWDVEKRGMLLTSRDYPGNSVFFPTAGRYINGNVERNGEYCYYWTAKLILNDPVQMFTTQAGPTTSYHYQRELGYSVRAVLDE